MSHLTSDQRRALWTERLERFGASSLTVAEFCRREAVSVPSFYNWKKRLGQNSKAKQRTKRTGDTAGTFVPICLGGLDHPPKLNLPGGASIELPSQLSRDQLTNLIAAVIGVTEQLATDKELR